MQTMTDANWVHRVALYDIDRSVAEAAIVMAASSPFSIGRPWRRRAIQNWARWSYDYTILHSFADAQGTRQFDAGGFRSKIMLRREKDLSGAAGFDFSRRYSSLRLSFTAPIPQSPAKVLA
jgi:hypothetical protein